MAPHNFPAVFDADGHVMETDADIFDYLPPPYRGQTQLFTAPFFPGLDAWHRAASRVGDGLGRVLERPTAQDWLGFLDAASVAVSVLFPTNGLAHGVLADPKWAAGLARGYNDWLYDRFLRVAPDRLKGMALIAMQDPAQAVVELRRAVGELGMIGAVLPAVGLPEALGHRSYWPVYEAAQDLNCLLAVHGAPTWGLGLEKLRNLIELRVLNHAIAQQIQMTSLILSGVFEIYPGLRIAFCEAGCGWVPYLMERLDREYASRHTQVPLLKRPPSEYLRTGQVFLHAELDERGLAYAIEVLGEGAFFCASDFPHEPKQDFIRTLAEFAAREDIRASAKGKLLWDNPQRMYGLV
ncbi:MAG: amidohydrolase [Deltaproteobacteria bacterium]|nr:amidohydrolase [Deltaproteobacteria bacterium]